MGTDDQLPSSVGAPVELIEALERGALFLSPVEPLRQAGSGFNSHVFMTAGGWVVRVARSAEASVHHRRESQLLPHIAPYLDVAVPAPRVAVVPCPGVPFGAMAYRALPGRVMAESDSTAPGWGRIAESLGRNLAKLHNIPPGAVPGAPTLDSGHLVRLHEATAPELRKRLRRAEWQRVEDWWSGLFDDPAFVQPPVAVTHRDPWWANLTIDGRGLSGILDWESLSLSDPATDLGVTLQMEDPFFAAVLAAYTITRDGNGDPGLEHRAGRSSPCRCFTGCSSPSNSGTTRSGPTSCGSSEQGQSFRRLGHPAHLIRYCHGIHGDRCP